MKPSEQYFRERIGKEIGLLSKVGIETITSIMDEWAEIENKSVSSIDKVTVDNLDVALRMTNIQLGKHILDKVIDIVELLEQKGDEVTMMDIFKLKEEWKQNKTKQ